MLGTTLGVEIDAYAFIGMRGLVALIDSIGGVDVTLAEAVRDPVYWTNEGVQGIYFPAGKNHLDGERALIFARTRKGDSDFQRIRRQQQLVQATAEKVAERGISALPALLELAATWVRTDLPLDRALDIFGLVANADETNARTAVLGPKYADKIPDSVNYELRMDEVRALVADWFAPLPGSLLGPPASPAPGPSTAP
jgi:anionic cell wall polymer biosynthesis LytR-Cps2A-Psr (LCP) family protein